MITVIGWAVLFLLLVMLTASALFATFQFHILIALAAIVLAGIALAEAIFSLAHVFSNSGGI